MFSSSIRFASSVAAITFALGLGANAADGDVRLITVAAENGYTYQWIPTEAGATLVRPGVRIVIRAGRLSYEVNEATPIADIAPRFDGRDIVISQKLAEHLREIARKYATPPPEGAADTMPAESPTAAAGALTLNARHIPGRDAVALRGTGPANVPVTITLTGELSTDLPVVVLSRKIVFTATDGSFFAEMNYGQDTHVRTAITATATALSEGPSAVAQIIIGFPSPQITSSGLDYWPKK